VQTRRPYPPLIPRQPSEYPSEQGIIPRYPMENYPDHPCDDQAKIPGNPLANRRRSPVVARNLPGDVLQMSGRLSPDNPPDPHPPFGELSPVSRGIVPRLTGEFPLFGEGSTRGISPVATYTVNKALGSSAHHSTSSTNHQTIRPRD
jgi:hypothetical protein